ncbi:AAA family ATPase [Dolichospermum sp. LEGE 00240]|uniref:AAA family ATPase n=1 Tax=Dolichospermum sp. LEGE 00240 TaxID=1828603 RepID=UPI001D14CDBF|nr:AAA family ATPase [Dolichospermum sp. LEGE 00240]
MLEQLILHNFKSHKSTELHFDSSRLHGLVGKNSAGKTTVLQALHNLSKLTVYSFEKNFKDENSPQFITTIGEKICLLLRVVVGKMRIKKNGKCPIVGRTKIQTIGLLQYHGI